MEGLKKEVVSWCLKNILISLLPFIIGTIIRIIVLGKIMSFDIFSSSELAFSMSILYLIVYQSVGNLDDLNLKDSLYSLLMFGIMICIIIFALSIFAKLQIETEFQTLLNSVKELDSNQIGTCELIQKWQPDRYNKLLNGANWFSIGITVISIPLIIVLKNKYKLN
jgi:hypothetical protein